MNQQDRWVGGWVSSYLALELGRGVHHVARLIRSSHLDSSFLLGELHHLVLEEINHHL